MNKSVLILFIGSIGILTYLFVKSIFDKINIVFKIDESKINLSDLLSFSNNNNNVRLPVVLYVDNQNNFDIKIKNFYLEGYYQNNLIMKSDKNSPVLKNIIIPKNVIQYELKTDLLISINSFSIKFITEILKKVSTEIKIKISSTFLNFPVSFSFYPKIN